MHTSRFHLTITAGLAVGLGAMTTLALLPHAAQGYPTVAISSGSNPVSAWAGTFSSTAISVLTAPEDQDIVITDISLSCNYTCEDRVEMTRSDGTMVGSFWISGGYSSSYDSLSVQQNYSSGIPIPAGQSLSIRTSSGHNAAYTLSGYHAQP